MGFLSWAADAACAAADVGLETAKLAEGAGPLGAAIAATMHAGHAAYDIATGDDKGALEETIETGGSMLGAIPGVGAADVLSGLTYSLSEGGAPKTASGLAAEAIAEEVAPEDAHEREVSTLGTVGSVGGALAGLMSGGPMGMIGGARTGQQAGDLFSGLFD